MRLILDKKFLNWRLFLHPRFNYKIIKKNNKILLIYRLQKILNSNQKVVRIIYHNLQSADDIKWAFGDLNTKIKNNNIVKFCEIFSQNKSLQEKLKRASKVKILNEKINFNQYWPIKRNKINLNFEINKKSFFKINYIWHLIECDADRPPSLTYYEK